MDDVRDAELDKLMSELAWLKRLAVALVRDESDANDLVQETWLVASERVPTDGRPLKPWLSRVALNLVRMRSRSAKRRSGREAAVESFAESSPTPDELVSRVDAQRVVVNEVMRLAEPYRTTVLLHFFQDLSSAEIARRSGIPEGTVRRRLKTALDELRSRLHAEERKTGRAVVAVLAPLAAKQSAAGSAALGVVLVKKAIAVIVVVVGLLLVGAHFYKRQGSDKAVVAAAVGSAASRSVAPAGSRAAHVTVAVADGAGPVANAVVRCAVVNGGVVIGKTASDGNAVVDLAAGEWSIAASADGHEPAATTLRVEAGRDDKTRVVLASGGRTVTGIVTDATGGVIAGARIDAAKLDLHTKVGRAVAVTFTDAAGHYKLSVAGGTILVAASHAAYAAQERYVDLGASGATANFALVPGGVIEGIVRDSQSKQPVAGAVVYAERDAASLELGDSNDGGVKADGEGKFRVAGLRPGNYNLRARAGARLSRTPVSIDLGVAEQQTEIVVVVGPAATIRGKVVDGNGSAVAKVTVHASGGGSDETTISDDTGAFAFEGLAPGRWQVNGTSERYLADGRAIVPLAKTDVDGVVVRVRGGSVVAGHVEPRELCDVEITQTDPADGDLRQDSMTTGPDGSFRFSPFAPDKVTLSARCPNGDEGTSELVVAAGSEDNVVRVAPGGSIEGRVVDAAGKPVDSVMVTASVEGETTVFENGVMSSGFKALSSAGGAFEIHGLGAGTYHLGALASGIPMKPKKAVKVTLTAGQHAAGIEVIVERPTGSIRGTVVGPDGAAMSDAWIVVHQTTTDQIAALRASDDNGPNGVMVNGAPIGGSEQPPVLSDAHGHFDVANLLPGRYQVVVEARGGQLRGGALNVTTDADLTIHLSSEGALHGTVHGARGPTELFSVRVAPPGALDAIPPPPGPLYGGSFTDGTFTFPRIDPGDYAIEVNSTEGTGKATVHVATNEDASVDVVLASNGTVSGRVVDNTGKPISGIGAALIPDQPPGKFSIMLHEDPVTTGPDGRFQVAGPAGTWTLAILGSTPTLKRGVAVAADKTLDVGDITVAAPSPPATAPAPAPAP